MAKDIRRCSLPVGTQKTLGGYQPLASTEQATSFRHNFFHSRSPAGKLKRFFQRYRSQSEACDDSCSISESSDNLQMKSGRMFGDIFLCHKCAESLEQFSDKQQQRQRGDSLKEELLGGNPSSLDSDPAYLALQSWQCAHKWNSSREAPSGRQSSSSHSADSGIPTPTFAEMAWTEMDQDLNANATVTEQVLNFLMHRKSVVAGASRRDSGQGDDVKNHITGRLSIPSSTSSTDPNIFVCALCSTRVSMNEDENEKTQLSSTLLATTPECPDNSVFSQISNSSTNTPPSVEVDSKRRFSQRLRLRSISTCDSESSGKDETDRYLVKLPPKEPSKLPSCMPNSGITFVDGKLKLADKKRLRSLSTSTETRAFRAAKSKSLVEDNLGISEFWSTNQQLWQTLNDARQLNVLEQALAEENRVLFSKLSVTPYMSRISENNRYVMLSRTPCVDRKTCETSNPLSSYQDEDIFLALFRHSSMYDVLPESGKLIVLYSDLSVDRAYNALVNNQILSAAVWNKTTECFDGVFDLRYFIHICHYFYTLALEDIAAYKRKTITEWKGLIEGQLPPSVTLHPDQHLHYAVNQMQLTSARHISVFDPVAGNTLGLVSASRMFRYLCQRRTELPNTSMSWMQQIGCQVDSFPLCVKEKCSLVTADMPMSRVLDLFMQGTNKGQVLAVMEKTENEMDDDVVERLVDVLTEMDCVHFLLNFKSHEGEDTVKDCLKYSTASHAVYRRIVRCRNTETIANFADRFYYYDVDFIVIVDCVQADQLIGIVYIHDFLNWLIFHGE